MKLLMSAIVVASAMFIGCTGKDSQKKEVLVDGSSTVFPMTEAVAEEFSKTNPRIRVKVGMSGTGGGFKKFTSGRTDINNASREIRSHEIKQAKKNNINYKKISVAYDGITVVVNTQNDWVDKLTTSELKRIWQSGSQVKTWADVRKGWPDEPIKLYGPGTDSGTFDYFTEAINGKAHSSRSEFTKSEDDNVLVQGVAGDKYSLGYFGYAYYLENKDKVKIVGIDTGDGKAVYPNSETIQSGTYKPLSRHLFLYLNTDRVKTNDSLYEFMTFYVKNAKTLSKDVGYVPLEDSAYKARLEEIESMRAGK